MYCDGYWFCGFEVLLQLDEGFQVDCDEQQFVVEEWVCECFCWISEYEFEVGCEIECEVGLDEWVELQKCWWMYFVNCVEKCEIYCKVWVCDECQFYCV